MKFDSRSLLFSNARVRRLIVRTVNCWQWRWSASVGVGMWKRKCSSIGRNIATSFRRYPHKAASTAVDVHSCRLSTWSARSFCKVWMLLKITSTWLIVCRCLWCSFIWYHSSSGDWQARGAKFGKVPSKSETIFGYKLHLLVAMNGVILDFELAPANEMTYKLILNCSQAYRLTSPGWQSLYQCWKGYPAMEGEPYSITNHSSTQST